MVDLTPSFSTPDSAVLSADHDVPVHHQSRDANLFSLRRTFMLLPGADAMVEVTIPCPFRSQTGGGSQSVASTVSSVAASAANCPPAIPSPVLAGVFSTHTRALVVVGCGLFWVFLAAVARGVVG